MERNDTDEGTQRELASHTARLQHHEHLQQLVSDYHTLEQNRRGVNRSFTETKNGKSQKDLYKKQLQTIKESMRSIPSTSQDRPPAVEADDALLDHSSDDDTSEEEQKP